MLNGPHFFGLGVNKITKICGLQISACTFWRRNTTAGLERTFSQRSSASWWMGAAVPTVTAVTCGDASDQRENRNAATKREATHPKLTQGQVALSRPGLVVWPSSLAPKKAGEVTEKSNRICHGAGPSTGFFTLFDLSRLRSPYCA